MSSNILNDKKPIVINTKLAELIGLNESIVLQQINYWIENINKVKGKDSINYQDNHYWTFNSYDEWQKNFSFWSKRTIRRAIKKLEKYQLIETGNYNKFKIDRTKWYRIRHKNLDEYCRWASGQNGQSTWTKWTVHLDKMARPLPESTTETTTEITTESTKAIVEKEKVEEISDSKNPNDDAKIPYKKIVDYLNQKLDTNYRHTTQKTKTLIRARWNEGFKLVDFKTVIEKKAMEWLGDKKMEKYLRPVTLFGTKFEGYLNQLSVNNQSDNSGIKQLKELWAEAELEELEGSEGDYIL